MCWNLATRVRQTTVSRVPLDPYPRLTGLSGRDVSQERSKRQRHQFSFFCPYGGGVRRSVKGALIHLHHHVPNRFCGVLFVLWPCWKTEAVFGVGMSFELIGELFVRIEQGRHFINDKVFNKRVVCCKPKRVHRPCGGSTCAANRLCPSPYGCHTVMQWL